MARKRLPGLYSRQGVWHIDKQVDGRRWCESTGTTSLDEAEHYLVRRLDEHRQAKVFGVRPLRTFRAAAIRYLTEKQQKASLSRDAYQIKILDPFIGDLPLHQVHMGTLGPFIQSKQQQGVKCRTLNYALQVTRQILNLATTWLDEQGLSWLASAPKITLFKPDDARPPYPLSWEEQTRFFHALPDHLATMALFAVNTGCRDQEICGLEWSWETALEEHPGQSVFIIPGRYVKNRRDRLVVLNSVAQSVIEKQRGQHPRFVFTYKNQPIRRMYNTAWAKARKKTNIPVRVHDLKHTLGRRLRAVGVSFEDCQDLLGHKAHRITSHYTVAEVENLRKAANKVTQARKSGRPMTLLKTQAG